MRMGMEEAEVSLSPKSLRLGLATINPFVVDSKDTISSKLVAFYLVISFGKYVSECLRSFTLHTLYNRKRLPRVTIPGYVPIKCAYIGNRYGSWNSSYVIYKYKGFNLCIEHIDEITGKKS